MKIDNRSAYHSTASLLRAVEFVEARTKYSDLATLQLVDLKDPKMFSGGWAAHYNPYDEAQWLVTPALIKIQLSRGGVYPRASLHVREVGSVVVHSFEEEFLAVLSHEAQHVDDFMSGRKYKTENDAEIHAERFAVRMLKEWRKPVRYIAPKWDASTVSTKSLSLS